jgi:hypothetical protein
MDRFVLDVGSARRLYGLGGIIRVSKRDTRRPLDSFTVRLRIAVPELDQFHPPYFLGAFGCVVVGVWDARPAALMSSLALEGFEPMSALGGTFGTALILRYDRPAAQHPVAYSEVIAACAVRRGSELAAVPFDLVLDDEFNVQAGLRHYHLPKRLDPTLRVDVERDAVGAPRGLNASGADFTCTATLEARSRLPSSSIASALFGAASARGPIIGTASEPFLCAPITVRPDAATARRARVHRISIGGRTLRPLYAQFWTSIAITVGAPRALTHSKKDANAG